MDRIRNILLFLLCCTICLSAQDKENAFRVAVGGGFTFLKLAKQNHNIDIGIIGSKSKSTVSNSGNTGYFLEIVAAYDARKGLAFQGGIGLTAAKVQASRTTTSSGHLLGIGTNQPYTTKDDVEQKFTLLELPMSARIFFTNRTKSQSPVFVYSDIGVTFGIPLSNSSTFVRESQTSGGGQGDMDIDLVVSPLIRLGLLFADQFELSIAWTWVVSDNSTRTTQISYRTNMTRVGFTYYIRGAR